MFELPIDRGLKHIPTDPRPRAFRILFFKGTMSTLTACASDWKGSDPNNRKRAKPASSKAGRGHPEEAIMMLSSSTCIEAAALDR